MDITSFAQALSSNPRQTLLESELREMSTEQLMDIIHKKDITATKLASDPSPVEKIRLADRWGRELAQKTAAPRIKVAAPGGFIGTAIGAAKAGAGMLARSPTARRTVAGGAIGAVGGAAGAQSGQRAGGALKGGLAGAAAGFAAKPASDFLAKRIAGMAANKVTRQTSFKF